MHFRHRGGKPFYASWPTDDAGTSRAERREIQQYLLARGYDIGDADGMIGDKSRQAIRQEQARLGYTQNGRGGQKILQALRREAGSTTRPNSSATQLSVKPVTNSSVTQESSLGTTDNGTLSIKTTLRTTPKNMQGEPF